MAAIERQGQRYEINEMGFLCHWQAWDAEIAAHFAAEESITLQEAHWQVIDTLRNHFQEYGIAPMIRMLCNSLQRKYGPEAFDRTTLHHLFPGDLAKQACRIAGLPNSIGCV
ncbi:MAG: TusE/DsrC/DsvC family sulfur relay protein [Magnetococcales bacterium]|nr:TusE/DsrC/DsvC family sulfur relay protein [Magnetococcales bacterium]